MWGTIWPYLTAVLPTMLVAVLFYFLMKAILQGDHRERLAQSKWENEQDQGAEHHPATDSAATANGNSDNAPPTQ
jgi:hypothetical protein